MSTCIFCSIAAKTSPSVVVWEDEEVMVFLEVRPARTGHCQIIPKQHYETFDQLPEALAAKVTKVGQLLATRMKDVYRVARVAFIFTGGEVPHAHAHVFPMYSENDVIFAADVLNPEHLKFDFSPLNIEREVLLRVREELSFTLP